MNWFSRTILSIITVLSLSLPIASPVFGAAPAVSLVTPNPAGASIFGGAPNVFEATAISPDSTITSVEVQPVFTGPPGALTAIEVFDPLPMAVPAPIALAPVSDTAPSPAGLPAGSLVSLTIDGIITAVDRTTGEWRIGNPPVFVYESSITTLTGFNNPPVVGDEVKIIATRALAGGPIVAEDFKLTQRAPLIIPPAGPAVISRSHVFEGIATAMGAASWTLTHAVTGAVVSFNVLL